MRWKRDKPLTVVHVDRLEAYRGTAVLAGMGVRAHPGTSGKGGTLPLGDRSFLRLRLNWEGGATRKDQNWYHAGSSKLGL